MPDRENYWNQGETRPRFSFHRTTKKTSLTCLLAVSDVGAGCVSCSSGFYWKTPTTHDHRLWTHHHRKWQIHVNALFGRCVCFLVVQGNISTLQNRRLKPKNKVWVNRYPRFFPSFLKFSCKESDKLNGLRRTIKEDRYETQSHDNSNLPTKPNK